MHKLLGAWQCNCFDRSGEMCVGFTNAYKDFPYWKVKEALAAMTPGSAVSFNRIGLFHFAIYLGLAWPKETLDEPIPLVCHFSGDASSEPMASVRLDDLREVVQNSTVRVYKCSCEPAKRMRVVRESLARVGEEGYNLVTNNCEHFVRDIINNRKFSYQSFWTFAAPLVQLPRLLIGAPIGGSIASSASLSACVASSLTKFASLGLINPDMDLLEISLSGSSGLSASVDVNPCCTKVYTGPNQSIEQELYHCLTCGITGSRVVCRACVFMCHTDCDTRCFNDGPGFCDCQHQMCLVSSEAAPFDEPTESAESVVNS